MRHNPGARISIILCVMFGVAAGFGQQAAPPVNTAPAVRSAAGSPAPEFSLQSVNGETVRLSDFHGQTVLIYFWATWVGPCKIMTPWLVDLQSKYSARGFRVLAVSLDDEATRVEIGEFADQNHMNYPVLIGNDKMAESYGGVPAMPESVLINPDGKIVERIIGLKSKAELEKSIRKALNTQHPDSSEAQK
jgi:cytochrome c biogenesis protein CcmG/thiol:disulfide interchange protein DsbE